MSTVMRPYTTRICGSYVAECPRCYKICAYWDEEDLDENGDLLCHCDEEGE